MTQSEYNSIKLDIYEKERHGEITAEESSCLMAALEESAKDTDNENEVSEAAIELMMRIKGIDSSIEENTDDVLIEAFINDEIGFEEYSVYSEARKLDSEIERIENEIDSIDDTIKRIRGFSDTTKSDKAKNKASSKISDLKAKQKSLEETLDKLKSMNRKADDDSRDAGKRGNGVFDKSKKYSPIEKKTRFLTGDDF